MDKIYETSSTYVIRPRSELILDDEFVKALDTVSRRIEINTTFAEVAQSDLIKDAAIAQLDLTKDERQKLAASASVLAGTNILEISAQGKHPELVRDFAIAVGVETVKYVGNLYDVFELESLDIASVPEEPSIPNLLLNLFFAVIIGGSIGVGLVYVSRYLSRPKEDFESINIIDPETGAYTKSYFHKRLHQEMSRVSHSNTPLSISLIKLKFDDWAMDEVTHHEWIEEMKSLKSFFDPYLKEEDILARYDVDTFGVLLPDSGEESALKLMKNLRLEISSLKTENSVKQNRVKVYGSIGLVTYVSNKMVTSDDELIGFANFALKNADTSSMGGITRYVISSDGVINEIQEP
jgi:diguanylate cyclase (GGDEF)-like protein